MNSPRLGRAAIALCGSAVLVTVAWTFRAPLTSRAGALVWGGTQLSDSAVYRQTSARDCGVAALHMLFEKHQRPFDVGDSLHRVIRERGRGLSFGELSAVSRAHGLTATGFLMDLETLSRAPLPAIAHMGSHFVVVDRVDSSGVVVRDPLFGRLQLPLRRFAGAWTGRVLLFSSRVPRVAEERTMVIPTLSQRPSR